MLQFKKIQRANTVLPFDVKKKFWSFAFLIFLIKKIFFLENFIKLRKLLLN